MIVLGYEDGSKDDNNLEITCCIGIDSRNLFINLLMGKCGIANFLLGDLNISGN
ncbi:hypothetical protein ACDX78_10960 [Virgibacillus oceani]